MDTPFGEPICAWVRSTSIRLRATSLLSDRVLVRSTPKLTEGFDSHAGYDLSSLIKDFSSQMLGAYLGLAAFLLRRGMEVSVAAASPVIRFNEAFQRNICEFPKRAASTEHPTSTAEARAVATRCSFGCRRRWWSRWPAGRVGSIIYLPKRPPYDSFEYYSTRTTTDRRRCDAGPSRSGRYGEILASTAPARRANHKQMSTSCLRTTRYTRERWY
mmetsp:Transcript_2372/g.6886  ORF Transcript_2372/g.6886 Transcript_2372/m.6886 type:complete len:215 (-) Transcript_2372:43-687(-)